MIDKEVFINIINEIKKHTEIQDNINKQLKDFEFNLFSYGNYEALLVELLEEIFKDKSGWIGYFLYDLDFGSKHKDGMIKIDGENVKLATPEDLYDLITDNNLKQIYKRVIKHNGVEAQLNKTIEELTELHFEVEQYKADLSDMGKALSDNMIYELSDVQNMINQLKIIFAFTDEEVEKVMMEKMQRTLERIHN